MKIPAYLKHKPVVVLENYDTIDGPYSMATDAMGLSLGLAQWNERGNVDISAKVWRHTGEKWSRQSEEIPLHRVLDLSILICQTINHFSDLESGSCQDSDSSVFNKVDLQGNALPVSYCLDNEQIKDDKILFRAALAKNKDFINERLRILAELLKHL